MSIAQIKGQSKSSIRKASSIMAHILSTREQEGITKTELANRIGVQPSYITTLEKGGFPRIDTVLRITEALGLELTLGQSRKSNVADKLRAENQALQEHVESQGEYINALEASNREQANRIAELEQAIRVLKSV